MRSTTIADQQEKELRSALALAIKEVQRHRVVTKLTGDVELLRLDDKQVRLLKAYCRPNFAGQVQLQKFTVMMSKWRRQ